MTTSNADRLLPQSCPRSHPDQWLRNALLLVPIAAAGDDLFSEGADFKHLLSMWTIIDRDAIDRIEAFARS